MGISIIDEVKVANATDHVISISLRRTNDDGKKRDVKFEDETSIMKNLAARKNIFFEGGVADPHSLLRIKYETEIFCSYKTASLLVISPNGDQIPIDVSGGDTVIVAKNEVVSSQPSSQRLKLIKATTKWTKPQGKDGKEINWLKKNFDGDYDELIDQAKRDPKRHWVPRDKNEQQKSLDPHYQKEKETCDVCKFRNVDEKYYLQFENANVEKLIDEMTKLQKAVENWRNSPEIFNNSNITIH